MDKATQNNKLEGKMRELRVESREEMSVTGLPYGAVVVVPREIEEAAQNEEREDKAAAQREADKAWDEDIVNYRAEVSKIVAAKHVSRSKAEDILENRGVFCPNPQPRSVKHWVVRAMEVAVQMGAKQTTSKEIIDAYDHAKHVGKEPSRRPYILSPQEARK
jgi:hypothetical protein